MGNETSTPTNDSTSLFERMKGRTAPKLDQIVIVRSADAPIYDTTIDENIVRLNVQLASVQLAHIASYVQGITPQLPILRSCLSGGRDTKDAAHVHTAIDARPLIAIADRLQEHSLACARTVARDQTTLTMKTKQIDSRINQLCISLSSRKKSSEKVREQLSVRATELRTQLDTLTVLLENTVHSVNTLNMALPVDLRLLPLAVDTSQQQASPTHLSRPSSVSAPSDVHDIDAVEIDETTVIDA